MGVQVTTTTQGPSWEYLKVNLSETLSIFGDKCSQNGSKNDKMAPRTTRRCPHEGPRVEDLKKLAEKFAKGAVAAPSVEGVGCRL